MIKNRIYYISLEMSGTLFYNIYTKIKYSKSIDS